MSDLARRVLFSNGRPHSVLVPHARLRDTHGLIGTRLGCLACCEDFGPDYFRTPGDAETEDSDDDD